MGPPACGTLYPGCAVRRRWLYAGMALAFTCTWSSRRGYAGGGLYLEEAPTLMGELSPILLVVAFWMLLGIAAFVAFRNWLKVPTEMEIEAEREARVAEEPVAGRANH